MVPYEERRKVPRVHSYERVLMKCDKGEETGILRDLSIRSAAVIFRSLAPKEASEAQLLFELPNGTKVEFGTTIARVSAHSGGKLVVFEFDNLEPHELESIMVLIEHLVGSHGGDARSHSRIARRQKIKYDEGLLKEATLENISLGGLAMLLEEPELEKDKIIPIEIPYPKSNQKMLVMGRVAYERPSGESENGVRVGIEFQFERREEELSQLKGLLRELLDVLDD